jgi:histidinol-phosphate aminotransferase
MKKLIKKSIMDFSSYDAKRDLTGTVLDANENFKDYFKIYKDEIMGELEKVNINRYPEFDGGRLRFDLACYAGLKSSNIIIGNGSDELISIIVNSFIDNGDIIVTASPTFSMYEIYGRIAGGKTIYIDSDENFNVNPEDIIKSANENKAKIVFICNPNNPTGTVFKEEELIKIIENVSSLVVIDEAYYEFLGKTVIEKVNEYKNLIVLRTLSKAFGLAGARVGYGASSKEIIDILLSVKPPYNMNSLSTAYGLVFLRHRDEILKDVSKIIERREKLYRELKNAKGIKVYKSGANFILIEVKDSEKIFNKLLKKDLRVRKYGSGQLKNFLRITIGSEETNENLVNLIRGGYFDQEI